MAHIYQNTDCSTSATNDEDSQSVGVVIGANGNSLSISSLQELRDVFATTDLLSDKEHQTCN
jgi:hypothetical protein